MNPRLICLCALWLAVALPARADGDWRVSAFGTIGAVRSTDEDAALLRQGISTPGRDGTDFGPDSILGVQVSRPFDHGGDLTAQVIVREDQTGHIEPRLAWAFARLAPIADVEIRIGRMRAPFFMYSDSIWINYANTWVRPPVEVYGLNPFSDLDGADLMWRSRIAEYDLELRPFAGRSRLELQAGTARLNRVFGINMAIHHDEYSLQVGHAESPFELPWNDPIFHAVDAALRSSPFAPVAEDLAGKDGYARFDSIGIQWDGGRYLFSAEYARRSVNRYTTSAHGWQLTGGRRFGPLTLYGVTARQVTDSPVTGADLSAIPPLQAGLDAFLESRTTAQHSFTAGLRWDFHRNAAFKIEFSQAKLDRHSWGSFFPAEDSGVIFLGGKRINLLSASIDLSF